MSLTAWLDLIRQRFSPNDGQILVKSLQQDPLVWHFIQGEDHSLPFFLNAPNDLASYAPMKMATWLIEQKIGLSIPDLGQCEINLPAQIKAAAAQALETVFNTSLPPADLYTAGLLALTLYERRMRRDTWKGLSEEIFINRNPQSILKNYRIWQTPFACLFSICHDFNDLIDEFISSPSDSIRQAFIPILLHTLITNPMDPDLLLDQLFEFAKQLTIDHQLENLGWLRDFNQEALQINLARQLLQTKNNREFFANVFSGIEAFDAVSADSDPLEKTVSYALPENVNRLAAFYFFTGNQRKAADTYQKVTEIFEFLKAQALFQTLADEKGHVAPTRWLEIIKSVPHSKQARLFYARSLIADGQFEDAHQQLTELPETIQQQLLLHQIDGEDKEIINAAIKSHTPSSKWSHRKKQPLASYYVHQPHLSPEAGILLAIQKADCRGDRLHWLEKYLRSNSNDLQAISIARDLYDESNQIEKSIELTSYLERIEPTEIAHKRSLARLYARAERWQDAFTFLQTFINSMESSEIEDLEMYAEAAVRTQQTETAISICQNILQRYEKNPKALVLLGEIYHLKGDPLKAIQHMESVLDLIPTEPDAWLTMAWLWAENDQTDRALETLKKSIKVVPNQPRLLRALGKAQDANQEYAEALAAYKQAYELDSQHTEGKIELADIYFRLGQPEHAYPLMEAFSDNYEQNPIAAKLLGHILLALEQVVSAEPLLLFAAEKFPEDVQTVVAASHLVLDRLESDPEQETGRVLDRVNAILLQASHIHADQSVITRLLADVERLNGQHQSAFNVYTRLAKAAEQHNLLDDWRLKYGLGQAAMGLGDPEVGLAALQDALDIQPSNLIIRHALADAFQATDLPGKAHAMAKSALIMAPQDLNNILWYAGFKTRANDPEEAVRALKEALQLSPHRSELRLWLAKALISAGLLEEAQENVVDFIVSPPPNPDLLHQAAYVCVHLNDLENAAQALEKALQIYPDFNPLMVMDLAIIYALQGQHKQALDALDIEQSLISQYPQIAILTADLFSNIGEYEHACAALISIDDSALKTLETDTTPPLLISKSPLLYSHDLTLDGYHLRLGYLFRALGHFEESLEHLTLTHQRNKGDIKLTNAIIETAMVGLDHKPVLEITQHLTPSELLQNKDSQDLLDLICSQVEVFLYQENYEQAFERFSLLADIDLTYPRVLAIKSRFAANNGDFDIAKKLLGEAIKNFNTTFGNHSTRSLPEIFRKVINQHSISEACLALDEYLDAIQAWSKVYGQFDTQPLFNWRYLYALVTAAEVQQIASAVSITTHSPGSACLSEEHHTTAERLLVNIHSKVPQDQIICMKARIESAFTGIWPVHLNVDACLQGPEEAAAVLIGSEDDNLIRDILEAYSNDVKVLQAYGVYALRHGRHDAIPLIEKALKIDPANPINHALLAYLSLDQPAQAIDSIETALSLWPEEPDWHILAADLHARLSHPDLAEKHIQSALEYQPENAYYWQKSASLNVQTNNFVQAKSDLEKSTAYRSDDPKSWVAMAEVNRRMGDISDALFSIRKASQLDPDDVHLVEMEMKLLFEQNNFSDLESRATAVLTEHSENETALIYLARALAKQGKFAQALSTLIQNLDKDPDNTRVALEYLKIKKEQVGVEKALPDLIVLAQNNPKDPAVLTSLTEWLIQANRITEAEKVAQTTLRFAPDRAEIHLMLGRLQRAKGDLDQAITHLSQAITLDDTLIEAYIELGKTYQERRDVEKAIEIFDKGSQANKSDPRPYYYAGLALKEIKDYPGAELMLKTAKKYSPDDSNIIRQLGVVTALNLVNNLREVR